MANKLTELERAEAGLWRMALEEEQGSMRRVAKRFKVSYPTALKRVAKFNLHKLTQNRAKYGFRKVKGYK